MEQYEIDLDWKSDFFEWLVFRVHKITSGHSQDFVLAFLWILFFSLANFFVQSCRYDYFGLVVGSIVAVSLVAQDTSKTANYFIVGISLVGCFCLLFCSHFWQSPEEVKLFLQSMNVFHINLEDTKGSLIVGLWTLFHKAVVLFLSYQFIISIRQNTRRQ